VFDPILIDAHNPSPMTGRGNNTYLIVGSDKQATLIDAGVGRPEHLAGIARYLHESEATLRRALITHAHPDHASGAPAVALAHPAAHFFKKFWLDEDQKFSVDWEAIDEGDRIEIGGEAFPIIWRSGMKKPARR
jgi:glyoxylase-like metal-dependent hydrolase (beta-lactamase superfamily II)